jgi:Polyketide cyclase / dehydrase and lipid transport
MASIRYERRVAATADAVWALVGDPARIAEWFPGVTSADVDGSRRVLHLATGLAMPERIMANDPLARRFVYRLESELVTFHLGSIDVIALGPRDTLCVYSTTAEPDTMALVIGGGTAAALEEIARLAEAEESRGSQDPVHHH